MSDTISTPTPEQYGVQPPAGPVGTIRSTGAVIGLTIITLGFYSWYYFYATHDEMKRHSGQGLGGGIAILLAIFASFVSVFLLPQEVGALYQRRGQEPPVTALTGLWNVLGAFIIVGPFIWLAKTNNALNNYWRSCGTF